MKDYEKIVNNLMNQIYYWRVRNIEPDRIILGIEIVKILHNSTCYIYESIDYDVVEFMGTPVTIDYKNKWIVMACAGKEWDMRNWLDGNDGN